MKSIKRYDGKIEHCDNGGYVTFADYKKLEARLENAEGRERKLEARVKELEADKDRNVRKIGELSHALAHAECDAKEAEAELARLKAQEAIFQVEVSGNHWLNAGPVDNPDFTGLPDGINFLYAEPRPAVLPPKPEWRDYYSDSVSLHLIAERLADFSNGADWMYEKLKSLGCQPLVVKLARDTKISPRAHDTQQAYAQGWNDRGQADKEAIRAAGWEIAE